MRGLERTNAFNEMAVVTEFQNPQNLTISISSIHSLLNDIERLSESQNPNVIDSDKSSPMCK